MALTRAQVETIIVRRVGALMTAAGLDGDTHDGLNDDLNDPIGFAIRSLDGTVADVTLVVDNDLSAIAVADYDHLFDLAEYRVLENFIGNYDAVDIRVGPRDEKLHQLVEQAERRLERLEKRLTDAGLLEAATLEAGVIMLDFAEHDDE